jgi:hypothetical protein
MLRVAVVFLVLAFPVYGQTLYQTPGAAQEACPTDTVVWLNTRTDIYHFQGERWYGNTNQGAMA